MYRTWMVSGYAMNIYIAQPCETPVQYVLFHFHFISALQLHGSGECEQKANCGTVILKVGQYVFGQPSRLNYTSVMNRRKVKSKLAKRIKVGCRLVVKTF